MKLMINRKVVLALIGGVIAVALVGTVFASDTKHMSTEGSLLIKSSTELDAFPHVGMSRDAHVGITTGYTAFNSSEVGSMDGNTRLLFHIDEDSGILVRLNNDGFGSRIRSFAWGGMSPTGGNSQHAPGIGQVLEADYLTADFSVGGTLGIQKNVNGYDNTVFGGRASWTNGEGMHISGEVTAQKPEVSQSDVDGDTDVLAAALYRGEYDNGWTSHGGVYVYSPGADGADSELGVVASLGRRLVNTDRSQVGVEGFVDYVNNDDNGAYNTVVVPGVRVGVVHEITHMLDVMAGVHAGWENMTSNSDESALGITDVAESDDAIRQFNYDYTLGLGAHFGPVTVDLNVHPEAIPTLTRFGSEDHMFGQMSVEVAW